MVRRYPHTIVFEKTASTKGTGGIYTDGVESSYEIEGRYENHSAGISIMVDGKHVKLNDWILTPLFTYDVTNHRVIAKDENDVIIYTGEIRKTNKLQSHTEIGCKG